MSGAPAERKRAIDGLLRKAWRLTEPAAGKQVGCGRLLSVSVDCRRDGGGALLTVLVGGAASTLKESTRLHRPYGVLHMLAHLTCAPSCAQAASHVRKHMQRSALVDGAACLRASCATYTAPSTRTCRARRVPA